MPDRNQTLQALLAEAGLTPRALARELNRFGGPGTVAETAPYYWRDRGGMPRTPLPALTAYVLSRHLERIVRVGDIWPGRASAGVMLMPATAGVDGPWALPSTIRIAEDWILGGLMDRRIFLTVSGTTLANAVSLYLTRQMPPAMNPGQMTTSTDDPLIKQIEASVPALQMLDDEHGGASGLGYVGAQVRAVMLVLREGGHSDTSLRRLLIALADLAHLAGWKAIDAAMPGLAQRYLITGLRAAHDAGYRSMEAHTLADLAFQSASLGDYQDGIALAEAAQRVARTSTSSVRASVISRLAFAYAAGGRLADFQRTAMTAQDELSRRNSDDDPAWMYYLTPNHLECQSGYAMILAGRSDPHDRAHRKLLRTGIAQLRTGVWACPSEAPSQRRALYEGAWLALGNTAYGHLDQAAEVIRAAIPRLGYVRSPRSAALLSTLAQDLRRRTRHHSIADVLPELETSLVKASS